MGQDARQGGLGRKICLGCFDAAVRRNAKLQVAGDKKLTYFMILDLSATHGPFFRTRCVPSDHDICPCQDNRPGRDAVNETRVVRGEREGSVISIALSPRRDMRHRALTVR